MKSHVKQLSCINLPLTHNSVVAMWVRRKRLVL